MPRKNKAPWLSADVMRRAFQSRLKSIHPAARRVLSVQVQRIGGFEDRSFKLRFVVRLELWNGRTKIVRLRGSNELQDQSRRQAYETMKFLWRHGFASGALQIARPITYFLHWRLLVYEEADGETLLSRLRRRDRSARRDIQRAALWLAKLHRQSTHGLQLSDRRIGQKRYWIQALDLLHDLKSEEWMTLRRTVRRVIVFEDGLAKKSPRSLVHFDFHPGNILVNRQIISVVDFTDTRISHPLVDVGTFLAQLDLLFRGPSFQSDIVAWKKSFVSAYHKANPRVSLRGPSAQSILDFMRFRVAFQSYLGLYLFGKRRTPLKQMVLKPTW